MKILLLIFGFTISVSSFAQIGRDPYNTVTFTTQPSSMIYVKMYVNEVAYALGQSYWVTIQNLTQRKIYVSGKYFANLTCGNQASAEFSVEIAPGETMGPRSGTGVDESGLQAKAARELCDVKPGYENGKTIWKSMIVSVGFTLVNAVYADDAELKSRTNNSNTTVSGYHPVQSTSSGNALPSYNILDKKNYLNNSNNNAPELAGQAASGLLRTILGPRAIETNATIDEEDFKKLSGDQLFEKGNDYWKRFLTESSDRAINNFGEVAFVYWARSAERGSVGGAVKLAGMFAGGYNSGYISIPNDPDKALELYRYGYRNGNTDAINGIASLYVSGAAKDAPKDYQKALQWYTEGYNKGNFYSGMGIAQLYENYLYQYQNALDWYIKILDSTNENNWITIDRIAKLYADDKTKAQGIQDYDKALEWFEREKASTSKDYVIYGCKQSIKEIKKKIRKSK